MTPDPEAPLASELGSLRAAIQAQAAATETALDPGGLSVGGAPELPDHEELHRQLASLRQRLDCALRDSYSPREARAELATLLFFAKTLRGDAEVWRAGLRRALAERERQEAVAQRARDRRAAQRAELLRRRKALQVKIDQEAGRIADIKHGECRRTLPVIALNHGLTVSSMTVSRARTRFRSVKLWLVTLDDAGRDVLVRRD